MPRVLIVNWPRDELSIIHRLKSKLKLELLYNDFRSLPSLDEFIDFDLIYYPRVGPDILGNTLPLLKLGRKGPSIIVGILEPTFFPPHRPKNYVYNILSTLWISTLKLREHRIRAFHVLNTYDYTIYTRIFNQTQTYLVPYAVSEYCSFDQIDKGDMFTMTFTTPEYRKGGDIAYLTITYMLKKFPDTKAFIVLSRGFLREPFLKLTRLFGKRVEITEFIPRKEFCGVLSRSHLLLFPSRWEVFGRVVIESLASGTPVICFDIPGVCRDVVKVKYLGYVAKPFDIYDFIRGVVHYYTMWKRDPEGYLNISNRCIEVSKAFTVEKITKLFEKMFHEVMKI